MMNERDDFGDLLKRITPYIHLEESQMAQEIELGKNKEKSK